MERVLEYERIDILKCSIMRNGKKPITTTIALDRTIYKRLKHLAVERDTTVRNLIRQAILHFLKPKVRR